MPGGGGAVEGGPAAAGVQPVLGQDLPILQDQDLAVVPAAWVVDSVSVTAQADQLACGDAGVDVRSAGAGGLDLVGALRGKCLVYVDRRIRGHRMLLPKRGLVRGSAH